MTEPDVPAYVLAIADQELAEINHLVDRLIEAWHYRQPAFDEQGFDELRRICIFMVADVYRCAAASTLLGALSVAIARLARKDPT